MKVKTKMFDLIAYYLKNLKLNFELPSEIIFEIAKEHELPTEYLARVVDDFENKYWLANITKLIKERSNSKSQGYKWGRLLPYKCALEYIGSYKDMLNFCLANKQMEEKFMPKFHSRILCGVLNDDKLRIEVYKAVLHTVC